MKKKVTKEELITAFITPEESYYVLEDSEGNLKHPIFIFNTPQNYYYDIPGIGSAARSFPFDEYSYDRVIYIIYRDQLKIFKVDKIETKYIYE